MVLRKALIPFKVFLINNIIKVFPASDSKRLNEWQHKGYIQKLINKCYWFNEIAVGELLQFWMGNTMLTLSYVSLESALSYYDFIPEGVRSIEAITTLKQ